MNIKELLFEDKAVSPVIGVILMVAITVILAAVIGTFVLGIGQNQQTTPQASMDFEYNATDVNVTITHTGGDSITNENTGIPTACSGENGLGIVGGNASGDPDGHVCWPTPITAGDTHEAGVEPGDDVRVIWAAPGGGKTNTIGNFQVPS